MAEKRVRAVRPTVIEFEDGDYAGARIVFSGISVGEAFRLIDGELANDDLIDFLGSKLKEWNLDDEDGHPLSPDSDGIRGAGLEIVKLILDSLSAALTRPSRPLVAPSSNGDMSLVESMPTVPLSESPAS